MTRRLLAVCSLVLAVALVQAGTGTAGARPLTTSTSCSTAFNATVSPGVGLVAAAQTIQIKGTLTKCSGGGVRRARFRGNLSSSSMSCSGGSATGHARVHWNTKALSILQAKLSFTFPGGGTLDLKVRSGLFAGDAATVALNLVGNTGNCVTSPLTAASFTGTAAL